MSKKLFFTAISGLLSIMLLTGCNSETSGIRPVEEEQIENVVKEYFVRNTELPEYKVTIEEATDDWAKVSLRPAGVEGEPTLLYLQKQTGAAEAAPTVEVNAQPGNEAETDTTTGWTIVLGPQADFSNAELDEVGVPQDIR